MKALRVAAAFVFGLYLSAMVAAPAAAAPEDFAGALRAKAEGLYGALAAKGDEWRGSLGSNLPRP